MNRTGGCRIFSTRVHIRHAFNHLAECVHIWVNLLLFENCRSLNLYIDPSAGTWSSLTHWGYNSLEQHWAQNFVVTSTRIQTFEPGATLFDISQILSECGYVDHRLNLVWGSWRGVVPTRQSTVFSLGPVPRLCRLDPRISFNHL